MKAKSILLLFAAIFMASCKGDKAEGENKPVAAATTTNFKVTINLIAKAEDTYSLFYTEDGTTDFKDAPISVDLGGSSEAQNIVYNLPEGVFPTQLRLDFGMNKNQSDIVYKSIEFEYQGKKQMVAGAALATYFRADESKCTFDANTGIIRALFKDGVRQFPSLYPHEAALMPELAKLAK